jgi:hypothetical protein
MKGHLKKAISPYKRIRGSYELNMIKHSQQIKLNLVLPKSSRNDYTRKFLKDFGKDLIDLFNKHEFNIQSYHRSSRLKQGTEHEFLDSYDKKH